MGFADYTVFDFLILLYRKYFICIILPSFSSFISINALYWDIDFKRRIISEYTSISSRRVNSMNSYAGKIIVRESPFSDFRYTIRNSYAGKFIGFEGTLTDTCYTIRNSYAGKWIISKSPSSDFRYTIRNSYAGKSITLVFTTDYYSIFYR